MGSPFPGRVVMFGLTAKPAAKREPAEPDVPRGPSDSELMNRFLANKDPEAFAALVDRYGGIVWSVCRRILARQEDAEDAFQAVFLVLVKQSRSIRNRGAIGSWLYGVAYRTAMKARRKTGRQSQLDRSAAAPSPQEGPVGAAASRELMRVLDEEISLLPDKFRAPFVLCCIEGLSKSEAAQELQWKDGTVSGRLAAARKMLQDRLTRRGVRLSAALALFALTGKTATAAVPALLLQTTMHGLTATAAGHAALSPAALALADGMCRTLAIAKAKMVCATLLAVTITLGSIGAATQIMGTVPVASKTIEAGRTVVFAGPPQPLFDVIDEQVRAVAFSPKGDRLVTAGGGHDNPGQIKFWNPESLKLTQRIRGIGRTRCATFSPDGKIVACGEFGGDITLLDAESGAVTSTFSGHTIGVNSVAFSGDGQWLVSGGLDQIVKLWDVSAKQEKNSYRGHAGHVLGVAFFHRKKAFVTGGQDKTARVWNADQEKELFVLKGHEAPVEQVAISPDDKTIATASWDATIRLWNAESGAGFGVLRGHQAGVFTVAFSGDGAWIASGSSDGEIRLWDAKTLTLVAALKQNKAPIWSVAFSPDSKLLVSGGSDTTARVWDIARKSAKGTLATSETRPVTALAYAPDGKSLAIATVDNTIGIFDAATGEPRGMLSGHSDRITCLAYSPDGALLASGSHDRSVRLWDPGTSRVKHVFEKHEGPVSAIAFAPNGNRLASAGDDGRVHLWDVSAMSHLKTFKDATKALHSIAYSEDGTRLAAGGDDNVLFVWSESAPAPIKLPGAHNAIWSVLFAGERILSGSDGGSVQIWQPAAGTYTVTHDLPGHAGNVCSLAHLKGTDGFVSGGTEGGILQWDLEKGTRRNVLQGHRTLPALAMHPAGSELVSSCLDGKVLRWHAEHLRPVLVAQAPQPAPKFKAAPREKLIDLTEFYQDFRDSKKPMPPLKLYGYKANLVTHPDDRGFHVAVAANPEQTDRIGVDLLARFRGDFEITAAYEIQLAEQPTKGHGVGLSLLTELDGPANELLEILRAARLNEGQTYGCARITVDAEGKAKYQHHWYPTASKAGQLRMTRKGTEVVFSAREGGAEEFKDLARMKCGDEDIRRVRFAAFMGTTPNSVDVFLKDLQVGPPGARAVAAKVDPTEPIAEQPVAPTRGRMSLILVALGIFAALLGVAVILGFRRRKPTEERRVIGEVEAREQPMQLVVCQTCKRRLRASRSLAGKRIKCPRCTTPITVPNGEDSQPEES
jgi:RNA polymerase sigma factor (sigma-70 family)